MYQLTSAILETIKTFCISILCSVVFSLMIYRETVAYYATVCFVLNLASLILFLFFYYRNWYRAFMRSFSSGDYWIPAIISFVVFCSVSSCLYIMKAKGIFPWLFQQTRFLEPLLNMEYKFVSFILAQFLTFAILFIIPIIHADRN